MPRGLKGAWRAWEDAEEFNPVLFEVSLEDIEKKEFERERATRFVPLCFPSLFFLYFSLECVFLTDVCLILDGCGGKLQSLLRMSLGCEGEDEKKALIFHIIFFCSGLLFNVTKRG